MSEQSSRRSPGARWSLRYGSFAGIERVAVIELQRLVQEFLPYVLEAAPDTNHTLGRARNVIVAGTPESSAVIDQLVRTNAIRLPEDPEGYTLTGRPSPWVGKERALILAGRGPKGLLNGVHAFAAEVLSLGACREGGREPGRVVEEMEDFHCGGAPATARRGLWTRGHTIGDYRRFLDHMAKLRLNFLVVWNEAPPVNAREVIAYAHDRGVRVMWGFVWGERREGVSLGRPQDRARARAKLLRTYEEQYAPLDPDGLYLQPLPEYGPQESPGTTAAWVTEWGNDIARALLGSRPDLEIFLGLHAASLANDAADLADLDPRVTIMWEEVGVTPYSPHPARDFQVALSCAQRLAAVRPGTPFALAPTGYTCPEDSREDARHGSFVLGERSREFTRTRLTAGQPQWDILNYRWYQCYPHAARFYDELRPVSPEGMAVAARVEEGALEELIQPSVSILAETLWNPRRPAEEILQKAMSPHYLNG